jgi:putative CocE/NonD family hydrolase
MRFLDTSRIRIRLDERVRAYDGTELSVDLYLPAERGRYPVLLERTAADNNRVGRAGVSSAPAERWKRLAAEGFIVASADVRGRGDSDGRFVPFLTEVDDGAATVRWLRNLSECDGQVGVMGSGYAAYCAWAAAVGDGRVGAVASVSPLGAVGDGLVHRGGAIRLDWLFWMHLIGGRTVQPANVPPWKTIFRHWPLRTMDDALGRADIWWKDWLAHLDRDDPFWNALALADRIAALKVPGLHVTGWWDGAGAAAHYYYSAARRSGAPQRLIIGPWDSAAVRRPASVVGGFDFGPRSLIDLDETLLAFFDAQLRNGQSADAEISRPGRSPRRTQSQVFITGRNEWITVGKWPPDPRKILHLYITSTLGANTRRGDGALSAAAPTAAAEDGVTHNPRMPVFFQPQFQSFAAGANLVEFSLDQAHITAADEALVYTGVPLEKTLTVVGRPRVALNVKTSAADADLYILLSDCFPLGARDLHLSHGAVRLATLERFKAGETIRVELEFDPIAHDFLPGHQIRLSVTPSLFPLYACNPQAMNYTSAAEPRTADIELLHGPPTLAYLVLPLAARDRRHTRVRALTSHE